MSLLTGVFLTYMYMVQFWDTRAVVHCSTVYPIILFPHILIGSGPKVVRIIVVRLGCNQTGLCIDPFKKT